MLSAGTKLGPYEIVVPIGAGGMGEVYRARDTKLNRDVAVKGIIHRDLKPANVKVRADGTVKVLDFGPTKAMDPVGSAPRISLSPTITTPAMTQAGVILGTAAYLGEGSAFPSGTHRADGAMCYDVLHEDVDHHDSPGRRAGT